MKNIDKVIHWKLIEISCVIAIVIVSFPLWKKLDISDQIATAAFYNGASFSYLNVSNTQNGMMVPVSNEDALKNLEQTKIKVINDTRTNEDYTVLLKIAKSSTLDYNCLNIALNNEVKALKSTYLLEDADYFYFALTNGSIKGEIKEYDFLMWMDENTGNEMQGKTLNYSFELQKQIAI